MDTDRTIAQINRDIRKCESEIDGLYQRLTSLHISRNILESLARSYDEESKAAEERNANQQPAFKAPSKKPVEKPVEKAKPVINREAWAWSIDAVTGTVAETAMTSAEIIDAIHGRNPNKRDKDRIYQAVAYMFKQGKLTRDDERRYKLRANAASGGGNG